jgi:hypothetical protein
MKNGILSRRFVLRGAVVAGCGLCLPVFFSGQANSEAAKKMTQANAQYQAKPKNERSCGNCANFIAASKTCKLVEGQVSPEGWCNLWAAKKA